MKLTLRSLTQKGLVLTAVATLLMIGAACESQEKQAEAEPAPDRVTAADVRSSLSSEFHTTVYSDGQQKNIEAITGNINGRQLTDDWIRLWFLNRPSSMTPYPRPY